jgi:hypothetical protein
VSVVPSHRANHWGTIVEEKAAERYNLVFRFEDGSSTRCAWRDAIRPAGAKRVEDGQNVEIKAAKVSEDTANPNWKIYETYHRKLRERDGYYALAAYRPWGRGVRIERWDYRHASKLPRLSWHGGGEHRDSRQAKLSVSEVF